MNERIRELIEQTGMTFKPRRPYRDDEPDGYLESDNDYFDNNLEAVRAFFDGGLEKFAALIVQECTQLLFEESERLYAYSSECDNMRDSDEAETCAEKCMDNIKMIEDHFGVKE